MKYSVNEFAKEIRNLYPGEYDDLPDEKLVELWLKKYPNDINKVDIDKNLSSTKNHTQMPEIQNSSLEKVKASSNCNTKVNRTEEKLSQPKPNFDSNSNIDKDKTQILKREELVRSLMQKYINEYKLILIGGTLLSILSALILQLGILNSSLTGLDIILIWFLLFFPICLFILLYRINKQKKIFGVLSSSINSDDKDVWVEKTWNSIIIHAKKEKFEVPHIMLPFSKDECIKIINLK